MPTTHFLELQDPNSVFQSVRNTECKHKFLFVYKKTQFSYPQIEETFQTMSFKMSLSLKTLT